jgi:hypothetical protein
MSRIFTAANAQFADVYDVVPARNSAGPSSASAHTGRNEREIEPVCGPRNS